MKKVLRLGLVLLLATFSLASLPACSTTQRFAGVGGITMDGKKPGAEPPANVTLDQVPRDEQSTYHYMVTIYPGTGKKFDPNPTLTLEEYNDLVRFDWYCAKKVQSLEGRAREMLKQGGMYGVLQGLFGMAGASAAFGSAINPAAYLAYTGITSIGGGLANGSIAFDYALNVAHGYCMTGMIYKADELEGKMSRLFVVPFYVGKAGLPEVSDRSAPVYQQRNRYAAPPPPPH